MKVIINSMVSRLTAMKRTGEGGAGRCKKAAVVRLNVGGQRYDTTRATLAQCDYFEAYLSGRMSLAVDAHGRLFIDRSGELFGHLLQFMRSKTLPGRTILNDIKHLLLQECGYYGMTHMAQRIKGELSLYDLRFADRAVKDDERLFDLFNVDLSPADPAALQIPLLPRFVKPQRIRPASSYYEFRQRFQKLSGGLMHHLAIDDGSIIFAGGAVIGAIVGAPIGDIDIFLCCNQDEALLAAERVFLALQACHKSCNGDDILVTRSKNAITFFRVVRNTCNLN